jgi:hypothetical protein
VSELSVLSHEYKTASDLSQAINTALIAIKKLRLGLPGAEGITPEELECSRSRLVEILEAVMDLLTPAETGPQRATRDAVARVPGALVTRLRTRRQGDLAYYLEELEGAATRLRQGVLALTDADLDLLDELAAAADAETSSVFRRLMRT